MTYPFYAREPPDQISHFISAITLVITPSKINNHRRRRRTRTSMIEGGERPAHERPPSLSENQNFSIAGYQPSLYSKAGQIFAPIPWSSTLRPVGCRGHHSSPIGSEFGISECLPRSSCHKNSSILPRFTPVKRFFPTIASRSNLWQTRVHEIPGACFSVILYRRLVEDVCQACEKYIEPEKFLVSADRSGSHAPARQQ